MQYKTWEPEVVKTWDYHHSTQDHLTFQISQGQGHSIMWRSRWNFIMTWHWPQIEGLELLIIFSVYSRLISVTFKKIYTQYYTFKNHPVVTFEQTVGIFWAQCIKCRARREEHFIHCKYAANSYRFLNMQAWNCSVIFFCTWWPLTLGANWRSHELKIIGVGPKSLWLPVLVYIFSREITPYKG